MIQHLEAILIIAVQLAIWAFYALFAVAGVVMAINFLLELLHERRVTVAAVERRRVVREVAGAGIVEDVGRVVRCRDEAERDLDGTGG